MKLAVYSQHNRNSPLASGIITVFLQCSQTPTVVNVTDIIVTNEKYVEK